ncbi:MAG: Futalosine hydrolase [Chlamydiae bacterium]|nr:Futalosine hydrolase [Chlamydiota bacterium]
MKKILLTFALKREAEATLQKLDAKPVPHTEKPLWLDGEVPTCYTFSHGWILLTDIGSYAAQQAVSAYATQVDEIWNLGFAGALASTHPLGSLVKISTVAKYLITPPLDPQSEECLNKSLPTFSLAPAGTPLVTSDFPIHSTPQKEACRCMGSLVDMEGYGVAFAASFYKKPCKIWKIVSDFASPEGRTLIRQNRHTLSELLADKITSELSFSP